MTMNYELFQRLQKAEAKAAAKDIVSRPVAERAEELEMKKIATDVAEMLDQFVSGLTMVENKNG